MDLERARKHIRNAWIAGLVSGGLTLLVTVLAMAGVSLMGFSAWNLLDAALILVLSFGLYRNSRTCAVTMFVYFVFSKVVMWVQLRNVAGLPLALVLGYFFLMGIPGTFVFHQSKGRDTGALLK